MRKVVLALVSAVLVACVGLWAAALAVRFVSPDGRGCVVIGYGEGDGSLWNVLCYADGWTLGQYFPVNFSPQQGPYAKRSRMGRHEGLSWRVFVPRGASSRMSATSACMVHLLVVLIPLGVLEACLLFVPRARRARRRRRGLCIRCGYDLRGATSAVCSECGYENAWLPIARDPPAAGGTPGKVTSRA